VLLKSHETVCDARRRQTWSEHLKQRTTEKSQIKNARCSSFNSYEIECSCVNDSFACRLQFSHDANLIFVLSTIIVNWVEQTSRYLRNDSLLSDWTLRHDYNTFKLNRYMSKISKKNEHLMKLIDLFENASSYNKNVSIVLNVFITTVTEWVFVKKSRQIIKRINYAWDRVCVNETHQEQFATSETILALKRIDKHVRKWFIIETFFESSSNQITDWIDTLQLSWEHFSLKDSKFWEHWNYYQR
jgi:Lhr-like helicase